jgi:hypothetical protein
VNPNKLLDPLAEADRLVREAFAQDWQECMKADAAYETAERWHVWREEGGPTKDDFDMPDDDEPAEDMG